MSNVFLSQTSKLEKVTNLSWKIQTFLAETLWGTSSVTGPDVIIPTEPPTVWNNFIDREHSALFYHYIFRAQMVLNPELAKTFQIQYELSFHDAKGNSVWRYCNAIHMERNRADILRVGFAYMDKKYRYNNNIVKFLTSGDLNLNCCFKVSECESEYAVTAEISSEDGFKSLIDNLRTLHYTKAFSDFTIIVGDKAFPVHKCILSSRSSVFAAILQGSTVEGIGDKLFIQDFDVKTMETFILYLYTGQLSKLTAQEYYWLYSAAAKYALEPLKKTCAYNLINCISVVNVCDVYALGYYNNDPALKFAAKTYISKNTSSVLLSENWRKITSQNSEIASEILREAGIP